MMFIKSGIVRGIVVNPWHRLRFHSYSSVTLGQLRVRSCSARSLPLEIRFAVAALGCPKMSATVFSMDKECTPRGAKDNELNGASRFVQGAIVDNSMVELAG